MLNLKTILNRISILFLMMTCVIILQSQHSNAEIKEWDYILQGDMALSFAEDGDYMWIGRSYNMTHKYNIKSKMIVDSIPHSGLFLDFDSEGNLWLASGTSFAKYDGQNLTTWDSTKYEKIGLPNSRITSFKIDKKDNVWIGTWGEGLAKFDGQKCEVFDDKNGGLPGYGFHLAEISSIEVDTENNVWVCFLSTGIGKYDGKNWEIFDIYNNKIPDISVRKLKFDSKGNIWLTSRYGLAKYDHQNWIRYDTSNSTIEMQILSELVIDKNDNIWFTKNGPYGLTKFDGDTFTIFNYHNSDIAGEFINELYVDSHDNIWIAIREPNGQYGVNLFKEGGLVSTINEIPSTSSDFQVYPNPSSNFITIEFSNQGLQPFAEGDKVQIFDVLGIEVGQSSLIDNTTHYNGQSGMIDLLRIDVTHLPAGMYFIRIGQKVKKLVKM